MEVKRVFKIGEYSKLSMLTIKALRFYEKEGLLIPAHVDEWSGYRFYEASQLETAATIKALRQLDFSVEEIRVHLNGVPLKDALRTKKAALLQNQADISARISVINYLMEDSEMKYQAVIKDIDECIVYSEERTLERYSDVSMLVWIYPRLIMTLLQKSLILSWTRSRSMCSIAWILTNTKPWMQTLKCEMQRVDIYRAATQAQALVLKMASCGA